jgi:hypothetical protein
MSGGAAAAAGDAGMKGYHQGIADLEILKAKYPEAILKSKTHGCGGTVMTKAKAEYAQKAKEEFKKRHPVMTKMREALGSDTTHSTGDSEADDVINTASKNATAGKGTVAKDKDGNSRKDDLAKLSQGAEAAKKKVVSDCASRTFTANQTTTCVMYKGPGVTPCTVKGATIDPEKYDACTVVGAYMVGIFDLSSDRDNNLAKMSADAIADALITEGRIGLVLQALPPDPVDGLG